MFSLTHLRGRFVAVAIAGVLVLVAGIWVAMNHAAAQPTASGGQNTGSGGQNSGSGTRNTGSGGQNGRHSPHETSANQPLRVISVTPASQATGVNGAAPIKIKFSEPVAASSPLPTVQPSVAGSWQGAGTSTLTFVPQLGFTQYTHVTVDVPGGPQGVKSAGGGVLAQSLTVQYKTRGYSSARLDQLLAQLGYLPLTWSPAPGATDPAMTDAAGQLAAAYDPPQGQFTWQSGWPAELQNFWDSGSPSGLIVKGAVMLFENNHGLTMDGIPGSQVWAALLKAVAADQTNQLGYTYAVASEGNPETLTVWHDGKVILHSLANTGIQAAPTSLGTSLVYLRYYYQIMRGTNPDGSKYADPVYYVSYFYGGEAVHYFPRGSYGFPQSLGCVELAWAQAKSVWPYMNYGTLVTVTRGSQTPPGSPTIN